MQENYVDIVYDLVTGTRIPQTGDPEVENLFAVGRECEKLYNQVYTAICISVNSFMLKNMKTWKPSLIPCYIYALLLGKECSVMVRNSVTNKKNPQGDCLGGLRFQLVSNVGQQSDLTSTLDSSGQVTLVSCAGAGSTTGQDLATLGQVTADLCSVLVIDAGHLIHAECANLLALAGANTLFVSHEDYLLVNVKKVQFLEGQLSIVIIQHRKIGCGSSGS